MRIFYLFFFLLLAPAVSTACNNLSELEDLIKRKPKGLIVGCGQKPFDWEPSSLKRGQVNSWCLEHDGDHTHTGYITLAESNTVQPDIKMDWTQSVPSWMHNHFSIIYLEKLPPHVLDTRQCMVNAWECLKPGGQLVFDHQICQIEGDDYAVVSPFSISVPPLTVTLPSIATAVKKKEIIEKLFYAIAGITKDTPMNPENFFKLLKSNPKLEQLNQQQFKLNEEIEHFIEIAGMEQQQHCLTLRDSLNTQVRNYVESFGFTGVKIEIGSKIPNPYNKRMHSTLISAAKRH